jgi:hypothetical protein
MKLPRPIRKLTPEEREQLAREADAFWRGAGGCPEMERALERVEANQYGIEDGLRRMKPGVFEPRK